MESTYLSLLLFSILTIVYYIFKPSPQINDVSTDQSYANFTKTGYIPTIIYFLLVVVVQFAVNSGVIVNKCGGSVSQNVGAAAVMTFIPWVLIFGSLMLVLIAFPGFKSAFSNVIGYFVVAGEANNVLTTLLVNQETKSAIDGETNTTPEKKQELSKAAEAILKLCGNMSVLINQIVPSNFEEYWSLLKPLMKPEYQTSAEQSIELKTQLLNLVVRRDNIGEALWYVYTAVLLISVIQYNLTTRGCVKDPSAMEASHQAFLKEEEIQNQQQAKLQNTIYYQTQ
jgi:hypothetical protein